MGLITYDLNVREKIILFSPDELRKMIPASDRAGQTIINTRKAIVGIQKGEDDRKLVFAGPCSVHNTESMLDYGERLLGLQKKVSDVFVLVQRVYVSKPRTRDGWKGFLNDPDMDNSCNIAKGLKSSRQLMADLNHMGVPVASEILDQDMPEYMAGLISWGCIGARTAESPTHREWVSGLSMPVGFKNGRYNGVEDAVNAIYNARLKHSFIGSHHKTGQKCIINTKGNKHCQLVLRGYVDRPNYDSFSVREAMEYFKKNEMRPAIIIDCSHDNSRLKGAKDYRNQLIVWNDVLNQILTGNNHIVGLMLESSIYEGYQDISEHMEYGVSVTDPCISWETTEELILSGAEKIRKAR